MGQSKDGARQGLTTPDRLGSPALPGQQERYRKVAELLREWMGADDGYDDEIWPLIEEELRDPGIRCRVGE